MTERIRIATPHVLFQAIDGEVILIHRGAGTYHSAPGTGALLVERLTRGDASLPELVSVLERRTDGERTQIEGAVVRFIEELWRFGLVVATDEVARVEDGVGPKVPFAEPRLDTFTDLQDLLTADPVHDVEPLGWPHVTRQRAP